MRGLSAPLSPRKSSERDLGRGARPFAASTSPESEQPGAVARGEVTVSPARFMIWRGSKDLRERLPVYGAIGIRWPRLYFAKTPKLVPRVALFAASNPTFTKFRNFVNCTDSALATNMTS